MIMKKDVALVLSSGGPRGFAYIGAIEELLASGYNITSVAGTSMGSLIGGIFAAGKLEEAKKWFFSLDTMKVLSLIDFTFSLSHVVKGEKVIEALKKIVPDVNIEDLPIPYRAVATDLYTGEEVVFDKGSLFNAIRASISLPSLFRPAKSGIRTMIDGGIVNPLPLDRAVRNGNDILVALNVNDIDVPKITKMLEEYAEEELIKAEQQGDGISGRLRRLKEYGHELLHGKGQEKEENEKKNDTDITDIEDNYYTVLSQSFSLMIHRNTQLALKLTPPDILVNIPYDAVGGFAYDKAEELADMGRRKMKEALEQFNRR